MANILRLTLGFRCQVDEICPLLGYYRAYGGNSLPTFWSNLAVPCSRVKNSISPWISWPLKMGLIGCPETSVGNYHHTLCNNLEEGRSHLI